VTDLAPAPDTPDHPSRKLAALDPVMAGLVERHGLCPLPTRSDHGPYQSLLRAIVYQQLSGKAAGTILGRVLTLFGDSEATPDPEALVVRPDEDLRACGLSRQKIAALKDLAVKRLDGTVPARGEIEHLDDDEIVARLTAVRGVGRWTVEMYLMFTLGRPDVWPADDLGVRKGWAVAHGLRDMPTARAIATMADHLRPWRSHAAWYCYRALDTLAPEI
jgi:DNA-3-methyladenine glycosylase II